MEKEKCNIFAKTQIQLVETHAKLHSKKKKEFTMADT